MTLLDTVNQNDEKMFHKVMGESFIHPLGGNDLYRAMDFAAKKGYVVYLERLAPLATRASRTNAFQEAAGYGNLECVKALQPYISDDDNFWLLSFKECAHGSLLVGALPGFASDCNHAACLDILAPHVSKDEANKRLAFIGGQCSVDVLNVLLKYADPHHNNSKALQKAVLKNAQHNIDILYPISDPVAALKDMQCGVVPLCTPQDWMPLFERIESDRLKIVLDNEVNGSSARARVNKI